MAVEAVSTTGIYCRPDCVATPNPENTSTYPSPVAAEAAGYRSCLRCRPYRTDPPLTGDGVPPAITAALALISEGYLDTRSEPALASRIGYSTRQMRRLFDHHVGATPDFVARSRRAHFARRLLDETDLNMTATAGAAGFGSVRQMNRVMDEIFRMPPRDLRAKRRKGDVLVADGGLRLNLSFSGEFNQKLALDHLRPRVTSRVESVDGDAYRRTTQTCGNPGVLEVVLAGHDGRLEIRAHLPTFDSIIDDVARVRAMFGLNEDHESAEDHLMADSLLGPVIRRQRGLRVLGGWDRFETAVRVVVGQQISVSGATKVASRIAAQWGSPLPGEVLDLDRMFPDPDVLADLPAQGVGMPEARVETVRGISRAVIDGSLDLYGAADPSQARDQLLGIRGVGPWTADMIEMRALRNPDVFPAGDLGIRKAVSQLLGEESVLSESKVSLIAQRWRPHRALAGQHLWKSLG